MTQHQRHMPPPTFHNVSIHFRKLLETMSPFYSTIELQYLQYGRTDPEMSDVFKQNIF